MSQIQDLSRNQVTLFPESLDEFITGDKPVRFLDAFVHAMDLQNLGCKRAVPEATGRSTYIHADLRLHILLPEVRR